MMQGKKEYEGNYRPEIKNFDEIFQIAKELNVSPQAVVNYLVNVGSEVLKRSIPKLQDEIKTKHTKLIDDFFQHINNKLK